MKIYLPRLRGKAAEDELEELFGGCRAGPWGRSDPYRPDQAPRATNCSLMILRNGSALRATTEAIMDGGNGLDARVHR